MSLTKQDLQSIKTAVHDGIMPVQNEVKKVETTLHDQVKKVESTLQNQIKTVETTLQEQIKVVADNLNNNIATVEHGLRGGIMGTENRLGRKLDRQTKLITEIIAQLAENVVAQDELEKLKERVDEIDRRARAL